MSAAGARVWPALLGWTLIGLLAAALAIVALPVLAGGSKKVVLGLPLALGLLLVAAASRRPRSVLLFAWVASLTYNRQYWVFEPLVGDHGPFGPYLMVSDALLAVLLGLWAHEAAVLKRPQRPRGARLWPWYAPFALVAALSLVGAEEPVWGLGDLVRIVKLGLVLMYLRYNAGRQEWWAVVAGLGAGLTLQSLLGLLEVATGRTGFLWLVGLGGPEVGQVIGIDDWYGWRRATGTMGHPPYLASFMLLTIPVFMSLALSLPRGPVRLLCAAVTAIGLAGLAATLSRLPAAILVGQAGLVALGVAGLRLAPVTRLLGVGCLAALLLAIVGTVFADRIHDRITRDWDDSLERRYEEYGVAYRMILDHPLLGVGLNNYSAHMERYGSSMSWGIEREWQDTATDVLHLRILAGPLNGLLYVAAVTGLAGLLAFGLLMLAPLALGLRALAGARGPPRAAALGMVVGSVGLYLEQALDYSIWIDPVLATWTVETGLLALVPLAASVPAAVRTSPRLPRAGPGAVHPPMHRSTS